MGQPLCRVVENRTVLVLAATPASLADPPVAGQLRLQVLQHPVAPFLCAQNIRLLKQDSLGRSPDAAGPGVVAVGFHHHPEVKGHRLDHRHMRAISL
ncbi:hypothetical protein D3C72_2216870 [compost metagenome]